MFKPYAKAWVMVLATILSALVLALTDDHVGIEDVLKIALAGIGALVVFSTGEYGKYGPAAKFVVAFGTALLTALIAAVVDGFTVAELIQAGLLALAAVGVKVVGNNTPAEPEPKE
jgi:hypothetical protein